MPRWSTWLCTGFEVQQWVAELSQKPLWWLLLWSLVLPVVKCMGLCAVAGSSGMEQLQTCSWGI